MNRFMPSGGSESDIMINKTMKSSQVTIAISATHRDPAKN